MGVLKFNGTSDHLKWTTLAAALQNVSDVAWTEALVVKRVGTGTFDALAYLLSGSGNGVTEAGVSLTSGNTLATDIDGTFSETTTTFTSTTSPYMFVLSKGAGGVVPRLGWKLGSGGAWTHEDLSPFIADQIAATMLEIGAWEAAADFADAWIGLVAFWEGAMSDANKEALDNNWRTSDLWTSAHGEPAFLAELNVAGASVVDLAGNASDLTATGTTLDSGETLDSWNFDGTGAPAPPVVTKAPALFPAIPAFPAGAKVNLQGQPTPIFAGESFLDFTSSNSWTHTPTRTPRGVCVMIAQGTVSTDLITGVTYGGVAMTRETTAADTATEAGRVYVYRLYSGIPDGPQTVAVTVSAGTDAKTGWCVTLDADSDPSTAASGVVQENAANPSVTLGTGAGFSGIVLGVFYSGLGAPSGPTIMHGVGLERLLGSAAGGRDFGAFCAAAVYGAKQGANVVCNFVSATDDCAFAAIAINITQPAFIPRRVTLPSRLPLIPAAAAPTGLSATIGQVEETDTAQPITWAPKIRILGQVIETDLAQPVTPLKTKAIGQVTETDVAQPLTRVKSRVLGQVTETDFAQAIGRLKTKLLGQVFETDEAQAISRLKSKPIGQVTETDLAQPITFVGPVVPTAAPRKPPPFMLRVPFGLITRRAPLAAAQGKAPLLAVIGQVSETDTAQPITHLKTRAIGQVTETDVAQPLTRVKSRVLGQVTETDFAQAIGRLKTKLLGQALETDLAQPIVTGGAHLVAQVTETDTAQAIKWAPKIRILGQTVETDLAQIVTWAPKARLVHQVIETDLAQALTHAKLRAIGQVLETDLAQALTHRKLKTLAQATELDLAQLITRAKSRTLGQAQEIDLALALFLVGSQIAGCVTVTFRPFGVVEFSVAPAAHLTLEERPFAVVDLDATICH